MILNTISQKAHKFAK